MKANAILSRSLLQGKMCLVQQAALTAVICAMATTAWAQRTPGTPEKPQETPAGTTGTTPVPVVAQIGPAHEIKLAENTWFRFGAQVQAWFKAAQDRQLQSDGSEGSYAFDFYCRRCRFFALGSVVKDVFFAVLFESTNTGKADPAGVKNSTTPQLLDASGQVKFAQWFWLSGGQILMPLSRNGMQPTTTYVSIDNANIGTTPVLQTGNSYVLRDLGFQVSGWFADDHIEYRVGLWQGNRQAAVPNVQTAGHNGPRVIAMVSANLWDTETSFVNGGHYYGARKVLGVMGNFDTQVLRTNAPAMNLPFTGTTGVGADKNAYYGVSGAAFINYPLDGTPNPKGGDEIVGLVQYGYYDGGLRGSYADPTNFGTYPLVLKQTNFLAEVGYYNHGLHFSIFSKYEVRKISEEYDLAFRQSAPIPSQWWAAGGIKYYVAFPSNFMSFAIQYERVNNTDAPNDQQRGTNNITFQMQTLLY
jgi:hypothetical protein